MLKFITLFNLAGLFLFRAFFLTDVMITHETPSTMQAGTEVKVTVTIDKGQLSGFAKLQIDLPEGLSASAIETKGASFTFADGKLKFIWMALPSQPQFKVSYTLSAGANASGSLPVNGKFSYIEDNERKTEELPSTTITISGGAVAQDHSTAPNLSNQNQAPENTVALQPVMDNSNDLSSAGAGAPATNATIVMPIAGVAPQQGAGDITGTRSISAITEHEMLVEVTVNKGAIRGFGKLQEVIPVGFTALEKTSSEAIFTAQDRIVKFVWLNLPAANELKVVYKLREVTPSEAEHTVNGEFGYLLNDETQKAIVGSTNFYTGPKAMESQQMVATIPEVVPTPDPNKTVGSETTTGNNTTNTTAQTQGKGTIANRIPAPETGVTYKVQISAAHREVGAAYFAERHNYSGDFSIERHEGWIKYVTGRFGEYRSARDQRQAYVSGGNNFPGPFVTAYNNGDRVTVQEALMISNQKWAQ